ncbi:MAG: hypothetical protein KDN19_21145 [Verrucomicrobiae bacterium]|nr:hypothetical protein [Verrucomicrobiae bacterium]
MKETREPESTISTPPVGDRSRRWWVRPLASAAAAIYLGQLAPFFAGPLTECGHCVANYLKFYVIVPGLISGQWLMHFLDRIVPGNQRLMMGPDWIRLAFGLLVLVALFFCTTMITAKTHGKFRWIWLAILAAAAAANALIFAALLRA